MSSFYPDAILRGAAMDGTLNVPESDTTSGSGWLSVIGDYANNLNNAFYPDRILRNAAADGTITVPESDGGPDDGSRDWLSQLPAIGSAVLGAIGVSAPQEETTVTPVSYGGGRGMDLTTIALVAGLGLGVYIIATRK